MLGGIVDYVTDPTGMGGYRQGLNQQEAAQRAELEAMRGRMEGLGQRYIDTGNQVAGMYAPLSQLATGVGMQGVLQDYSVTPQEFQFQGQVSDYLDPSIAFQQQQAQRGIESSAAARGNLMSGAAAKAIADRAQQIGAQGYSDAYARMERDRAYGAGQNQQNYANQVAMQNQRYNQANNQMELGLRGLAGQSQALNQGTQGYVGTVGPAYAEMVNPTAGLANMAAGQMRGQFTKGLLDRGAKAIESAAKLKTGGQ